MLINQQSPLPATQNNAASFDANPPQAERQSQLLSDDDIAIEPTTPAKNEHESANETPNHLKIIRDLLNANNAQLAAQYIEQIYSQISSAEFDQIKDLFWVRARQYKTPAENQQLKQLLLVAAELFNEALFWQAVSNVAAAQSDWVLALTTMRKAALLENDPSSLSQNQLSLVKISSQLRTAYSKANDELSTRQVYQDLLKEHPNYPRFQLELAQSYLRSGDYLPAIPLLEQLQYDPQLGSIAEIKLSKIQAQLDAEKLASVPQEGDARENLRPNDIVVPLRRIGNSFLVAGSLGGHRVSMLLDTGASITALSTDLVKRLKLEPTGQQIRLSTANGVTTSNLFHVEKIRLGSIYVNDIVVAEIDLKGSREFQALLGTDLLNQADSRYSYLIDNTQNALIFRLK